MIRSVSTRLALAAALVLTVPGATAAQEATPEGIDWHLVWYLGDSDHEAVPWWVDATLRLEDGVASGSTGCNQFSGDYTLDGESLTFDHEFAITKMACSEPEMTVEAGYLAALDSTASWWIDEGLVGDDASLNLVDADGEDILIYALPVIGLTQADVIFLARQLDEQQAVDDQLLAAIDKLDERVDNVRISTLRARIKTLEAQVETLQAKSSSSSSGSAAMNAAEKVLLEAVPAEIARNCVPRRSDNPAGTVAALQCPPDDPEVRDMAYYLMEEAKASKVWEQRMKHWAVPQDGGSCWKGQASQSISTGALGLDGCYVDTNDRANLRYAAEVTNCRQLDAGNQHLKRPAVYIAVLGEDDDIKKLTRWAEPREWGGPQELVERIERPEAKWDPSCPR